MPGRPQGDQCQEIVTVLRASGSQGEGMTSDEIARRLQLSRKAASSYMSRLASRGEVEVIGRRQVDGIDRPLHVYRAVSVDLMPAGTLFESLNRVIAQRLAIREAG